MKYNAVTRINQVRSIETFSSSYEIVTCQRRKALVANLGIAVSLLPAAMIKPKRAAKRSCSFTKGS